jgi:hypothetical protein
LKESKPIAHLEEKKEKPEVAGKKDLRQRIQIMTIGPPPHLINRDPQNSRKVS